MIRGVGALAQCLEHSGSSIPLEDLLPEKKKKERKKKKKKELLALKYKKKALGVPVVAQQVKDPAWCP